MTNKYSNLRLLNKFVLSREKTSFFEQKQELVTFTNQVKHKIKTADKITVHKNNVNCQL